MASTRRVASRRVPLRRPSSEAEARAARLMGKSIFDFACRIDRGRARELVWSLGRNRATRSDPPFGCVAFPKNDPEVKCARPRGACESLTSRVRCSEPFLMIFSNVFSAWNLVHVYIVFYAGTATSYTCTEEHSICGQLRRFPSPCLAPSIELAFAANCMLTRTHYRHVERDEVRCFAFRGISGAPIGNLVTQVRFAFLFT